MVPVLTDEMRPALPAQANPLRLMRYWTCDELIRS